MKFLLLLALLVLVAYSWRSIRSGLNRTQNPPPAPTPEASPMVVCAQCGVHLPAADAITGTQGSYCTQAHRQQQEP